MRGGGRQRSDHAGLRRPPYAELGTYMPGWAHGSILSERIQFTFLRSIKKSVWLPGWRMDVEGQE